jgi:hypothetical protein
VLSVGSDRIDTERLQLCFELEESKLDTFRVVQG